MEVDELGKKLIEKTIELGAMRPANKDFSTKEIARLCGVSEFAIFDRFETKDGLVQAARQYGNEVLTASFEKLVNSYSDPVQFARAALESDLSYPFIVGYLCNYLTWLWVSEDDANTQNELFEFGRDGYKRVLSHFIPTDDTTLRPLGYLSFFRQTLFSANIILLDRRAEKEILIDQYSHLVGGGLLSYFNGGNL
jgi:AcrR family transcriptional regulator